MHFNCGLVFLHGHDRSRFSAISQKPYHQVSFIVSIYIYIGLKQLIGSKNHRYTFPLRLLRLLTLGKSWGFVLSTRAGLYVHIIKGDCRHSQSRPVAVHGTMNSIPVTGLNQRALMGYFQQWNNGPHKRILCSTWTPQDNSLEKRIIEQQ